MVETEARPVRRCPCGEPARSAHPNARLCADCRAARKRARDRQRDRRVHRPHQKPGPKPILVDPVKVAFKVSSADYDALYRLYRQRNDPSIPATIRYLIRAATIKARQFAA